MTTNLLRDANGNFRCEPHQRPINVKVAQVVYLLGCEECTRKAFAEALEEALADDRKPVPMSVALPAEPYE